MRWLRLRWSGCVCLLCCVADAMRRSKSIKLKLINLINAFWCFFLLVFIVNTLEFVFLLNFYWNCWMSNRRMMRLSPGDNQFFPFLRIWIDQNINNLILIPSNISFSSFLVCLLLLCCYYCYISVIKCPLLYEFIQSHLIWLRNSLILLCFVRSVMTGWLVRLWTGK